MCSCLVFVTHDAMLYDMCRGCLCLCVLVFVDCLDAVVVSCVMMHVGSCVR